MPLPSRILTATIIRVDNTVYVNGRGLKVDCSTLPPYFHALQWNGETQRGEIEFAPVGGGAKMPNMVIVDITPYNYLLENWEAERTRVEEEDRKRAQIQAETLERIKLAKAKAEEDAAKLKT